MVGRGVFLGCVAQLRGPYRASGDGVDPIGERNNGMSKTSWKMASMSSVLSIRSPLRDRGFIGVLGGEKILRGRAGSASRGRGEVICAGFQGPSRIHGAVSVPDLVPTLDT